MRFTATAVFARDRVFAKRDAGGPDRGTEAIRALCQRVAISASNRPQGVGLASPPVAKRRVNLVIGGYERRGDERSAHWHSGP